MSEFLDQRVRRRRRRSGLVIGGLVSIGLALLVAANAHLVYVAVTSQPDCVAHLKQRGAGDGGAFYRAARSSC